MGQVPHLWRASRVGGDGRGPTGRQVVLQAVEFGLTGKSLGGEYADQAMGQGEQSGAGPVGGVELGVDVLNMVAGRLGGDVQLGAHLVS